MNRPSRTIDRPWPRPAPGPPPAARRLPPAACRILCAATGTVVAVTLVTAQASAVLPRALAPVGPEQPPSWPSYGWAVQQMRPGEPVLTGSARAASALPGHGLDLVAPTHRDPALDERERRQRAAAVRAYLAPGSTARERAPTVRRYRVHWLLLTPAERLPPEAVAVTWSPMTGEVLARVPGGA